MTIEICRELSLAVDHARTAHGFAKHQFKYEPNSGVTQKDITDTYQVWMDAYSAWINAHRSFDKTYNQKPSL